MDKQIALQQVAETGRLLLEKKLVARTWGNFSARLDDTHFCITPSGLGYEHMTAADITCYCLADDTWEGKYKPSSEKGIHAAAYRLFPEVGFVIHTHQTYATALGLTAPSMLSVTEEEQARLGGIARAAYGLPGTEKLKGAVAAAMETGAHTVLLAHHGAVICGRDREDALARAELLEAVCRRSCRGQRECTPSAQAQALLSRVQAIYPTAQPVETAAALACAEAGKPLPAQLDDMAQMIGSKIPAAKSEAQAIRLLRRHNAVLLQGIGALVRGEDEEDSAALQVLTHKAAVTALHCGAAGVGARLSCADTVLMHATYRMKYSKKKKG